MAVPRVPWSAGGEAPGGRDWAGGWRGLRRARVQPSLSRADSHTLGSARPGQGALRLSSGLWSPRSRLPRLSAGPRVRAAGSKQRLPGLPGSAPPEEGRRERRRADCAAKARRQPSSLSRSAPRVLRLPEPGLRRRPVTPCGRARGAGVGTGARRGLAGASLPAASPPRRCASLRAAPGPRQPGARWPRNRVGGSRNPRPFRFSEPSTHAHGYFSVPTGFPARHLSQNLSFIPKSYRFFIIGSWGQEEKETYGVEFIPLR